MLPLDSPRWSTLRTAYGFATEIPVLLTLLRSADPLPESTRVPPMDSLWQALCHQGQPDQAGYAAVPHLVDIVSERPVSQGAGILHLAGSIIAYRERGAAVPDDLADTLLASMPTLGASVLARLTHGTTGDPDLIADLAAACGHARLGRVLSRWSSGEAECRCGSCGRQVVLGCDHAGVDASPYPWLSRPEPLPSDGRPLEALRAADELHAARILGGLAAAWGQAVALSSGVLRCPCGSSMHVAEGVDAVY